MVGIPRKPYCQPCKRRRVKCDEKWPQCSACKRAGLECPGPDNLTKFVLNNCHKVTQDDGKYPTSLPRGGKSSTTVATSSDRRLALANRTTASSAGETRNGPSFRSFRFLNPTTQSSLMTISDKLSFRLVSLMGANNEEAMKIRLKIFSQIPRRLSSSICLQDAVAYWCSSWVDYQRGLKQMSPATWQNHGRLLRSLQKAIQGPEALNVETLAAATILYQTGELLSYEQHKPSKRPQARGITTLTRERGLPNPDDPLDAMLAFENRTIVESLALWSPKDTEFYFTDSYKQNMQRVVESVLGEQPELGQQTAKCASRFIEWIKNLRQIKSSAVSCNEMARAMKEELCECLSALEASFPDFWTGIQEEYGNFTEIADHKFFLGKRYHVENSLSFHCLTDAFMCQILIARMIAMLLRTYNEPLDIGLEARYRQLCVQYWMFIPFLKTEDPIKLNIMPVIFGLTLEAATSEEISHVIDVIQYIDGFRHELGQTKEQVAKEVIRRAKLTANFDDEIEKELLQKCSAAFSGDT
ncbi:hypothetical protein V2G26_001411 [Clonostachys chloroleuca]